MLWIVGSKGLLGSALKKRCKAALQYVESGREVDIGSREALFDFVKKNPGITHIVNCAAFSQVDAAEEMREEAFRANAEGPENIALLAAHIGAKLIHISTDYVFSGEEKRPLSEKDLPNPISHYGMTKFEGEKRALALGACVIRTSWIFGEGGKNFVSNLLKMLQSRKQIHLTDDQWGRFTYAPDLADTIVQMLGQMDRKGLGDLDPLYQFANMGISTKYEFGLVMKEEAFLLGYPIMTESIIAVPGVYFPSPCKRPFYSAFDTSKIERLVKVRHFRDALKEFLCSQLPVYS